MPTCDDIARLTDYISMLESWDQPYAHWITKSGAFPFPHYEDWVINLFHEAGQSAWCDYHYDPQTTQMLLHDDTYLNSTSLEEIKTLVTACVRGERFGDGYWEQLLKDGTILRIIKRLRTIESELCSARQDNKQMKVAIASRNPAKITAVENAFLRIFPDTDIQFIGYDINSGVPDQPFSVEETQKGAENRVIALQKEAPEADFWAGVEGGIEDRDGEMSAFACIVITDGLTTGRSMTGRFSLPTSVAELVRSGIELGTADDIVFSQKDSKRQNGAVGLLTQNLITRTSLYEHAVILALIPFLNPDLYPAQTEITREDTKWNTGL